MAKKVLGVVKLQIPAGKATPAPPVGPALGQYGINIMEFVKGYNERTAPMAGSIIPVEITVFADRSFTFITKTPPASDLLRKAAGVDKGSGTNRARIAGSISREQLEEIARTKLPDLNCTSVDAACRIIEGTARSMGIEITA